MHQNSPEKRKEKKNNTTMSEHKQSPVGVVAVPFLQQGHLNQMLQLSSLISASALPVYFVSSALHIRQAVSRSNSLNLAGIHFHHLPIPPFPSPPPNPNSSTKHPTHFQPADEAMLHLRRPFAAFLHKTAAEFKRVVVIHDYLMSFVVQDVAGIQNSESYQFPGVSAFSAITILSETLRSSFPLPQYEEWASDEFIKLMALQLQPSDLRSGNLFNSSRLIEAAYMEFVEREELEKKRHTWAIGPLLPTSPPNTSTSSSRHGCLEWLDKQEAKSVIFVSFGTTVSLSDPEINELAHGLMQSKVKFLWVLRDADRCDVFEGDRRRAELPEGLGGEGMVVREWAPQPQILAHRSIGGFMSHCGWNSCIESITMGVPMAAWPMHSDQPMNAALVADDLKIGILVREWKERKEVVKASRIEDVVRRLMASEDMRKRAEELGAAMRRGAEPGGASRLELDSFIAHITRDRE